MYFINSVDRNFQASTQLRVWSSNFCQERLFLDYNVFSIVFTVYLFFLLENNFEITNNVIQKNTYLQNVQNWYFQYSFRNILWKNIYLMKAVKRQWVITLITQRVPTQTKFMSGQEFLRKICGMHFILNHANKKQQMTFLIVDLLSQKTSKTKNSANWPKNPIFYFWPASLSLKTGIFP